MKKTVLLLLTLSVQQLLSQTMDNINKLYPAAPAANNLMKFEEVPVSNYTGIPDITIPIAGIPTNNPKVAMNVSLNYHPLNAKPDDKSGETGLGWSLFAGGSITRTVRGTPDDRSVLASLGGQPTIGILIDEFTSGIANKNYTRKYLDALATGIGLDPGNIQFKTLFYEALYLNRYDTEYDLYQYNFMGYSGRFIVKKDSSNQLYVEKLDKNNLKITINALNPHPNNNFEAIAFVITDEQGNKYTFDIVERSQRSTFSRRVGFNAGVRQDGSNLGYTPSAFHLSKITDAADSELVKLHYYPEQQLQYTDNSEITRYRKHQDDGYVSGSIPPDPVRILFDKEIPAALETHSTTTNSYVRNLKDIEIVGKGKINFTYLQGRSDTNYGLPQQLQKLDKINIIDFSGKTIENYQFSYNNFNFRVLGSDIDQVRLSLSKITKYNAALAKEFDYAFNYNENTAGATLSKDHWGWFNCPSYNANYFLAKDVSPECVNINILKSIKLPSGGLRVFDFGTNTYSSGQTFDLYENPENWEPTTNEVAYLKTENNVRKYFFTIDSPKNVDINTMLTNQIANYTWSISFYRKDGNTYTYAASVGPGIDPDPAYPQDHTRFFEAGEYYIVFNVDFMANFTGTVNFTATHKTKKTINLKNYVVGGGIRINNISYYDKPGDAIPNKKVNYSYDDVSGPSKSSGALVFPKPVHNYEYSYNNDFLFICGYFSPLSPQFCKYSYSNTFTIYSSQNFIPIQKTQGADVGYQRVVVSETGKGESIYTYTSPIDQPNPDYVAVLPPFYPVTNYDYKRGLLMEEQKKDNATVLQYKKSNQYNTYHSEKLTGINLRHMSSPQFTEYIYGGQLETYGEYMALCSNGGQPDVYCGTNDPASMIGITPSVEIIGKANPNHSETTEYLNGKMVKTVEDITFNTRDYPTKQVTVDPDSKITETTYQYAHEKSNTRLVNANIIGIPLETSVLAKQDPTDPGKVIGKSETKFDDPNHLFPTSALSYDLQDNASTEVTYDKYDAKSNLQQYTGKDGIPVVIVWGYNGTQPIAKVEGITYDQLNTLGLIASIVSASDTDASDPLTEHALITALDTFRKSTALAAAIPVTTYTYDPLIGITSITPPSGIREVYLYDTANRLKEIREKDTAGKIIKEFKYNYKN